MIALVEQLCAQIAALAVRVKALEDQLATNSRNRQPASFQRRLEAAATLATPARSQEAGRTAPARPGRPSTRWRSLSRP